MDFWRPIGSRILLLKTAFGSRMAKEFSAMILRYEIRIDSPQKSRQPRPTRLSGCSRYRASKAGLYHLSIDIIALTSLYSKPDRAIARGVAAAITKDLLALSGANSTEWRSPGRYSGEVSRLRRKWRWWPGG